MKRKKTVTLSSRERSEARLRFTSLNRVLSLIPAVLHQPKSFLLLLLLLLFFRKVTKSDAQSVIHSLTHSLRHYLAHSLIRCQICLQNHTWRERSMRRALEGSEPRCCAEERRVGPLRTRAASRDQSGPRRHHESSQLRTDLRTNGRGQSECYTIGKQTSRQAHLYTTTVQ